LIQANGLLMLSLSDQHCPAVVTQPGACVATYRVTEMGMTDLVTHILSTDVSYQGHFGAKELLVQAGNAKMSVILSVCSGTGLFKDGPGPYVQSAQTILKMCALNEALGHIKQLLFPTPLVHSIEDQNDEDSTDVKAAKMLLEATLTAKAIAINCMEPGVICSRTPHTDDFKMVKKARSAEYRKLVFAFKFSAVRGFSILGNQYSLSQPLKMSLHPTYYRWPEGNTNLRQGLTLDYLAGYSRAMVMDFGDAATNIYLGRPSIMNLHDFILMRHNRPNMMLSARNWTELVNTNLETKFCVNPTKHAQIMTFPTNDELREHGKQCWSG